MNGLKKIGYIIIGLKKIRITKFSGIIFTYFSGGILVCHIRR